MEARLRTIDEEVEALKGRIAKVQSALSARELHRRNVADHIKYRRMRQHIATLQSHIKVSEYIK
jgi:hypothetical protein